MMLLVLRGPDWIEKGRCCFTMATITQSAVHQCMLSRMSMEQRCYFTMATIIHPMWIVPMLWLLHHSNNHLTLGNEDVFSV
jgi:hypothetical protein